MVKLSQDNMVLLVVVLVIVVAGGVILFWEKINKQQTFIMEAGAPVNQQLSNSQQYAGEEQDDEKLIIHITGEVKRAGVYELAAGARVIDAIKVAGGETITADLDKINLAALIYDGDKIIIPALTDEQDLSLSVVPESNNGKININKASAEQLEQLPGIGPSKADSIIKYRNKKGRITDLNQLLEVSGIGEKTLEKIIDELTLR